MKPKRANQKRVLSTSKRRISGSRKAKTPPEPSSLEASYTKFVRTPKGTPEHEKAGDELVDALFANAK